MNNHNEFKTALKAIDLEIKNNPENLEAWGTKATILLKLAELTDNDDIQKSSYLNTVIETANFALQKDPQEIRLWDLLATAHLQQSHLQQDENKEEVTLKKALSAIDKALEVNQNLAGFWFVKGLIFDRLDDKEQATLAFDKATLLKVELIDELPEDYKIR